VTSPAPEPPRHLRPVNGQVAGVHEPPADVSANEAAPAVDATTTGTRRVLLTPAAGVRLRPTHWLWDGRLPHGAITVGPGREGIGKSLFCAWLAARITLGELPGLYYGQPKSVIYAATEDSWERTLAGRLVVAGADMNRVWAESTHRDRGRERCGDALTTGRTATDVCGQRRCGPSRGTVRRVRSWTGSPRVRMPCCGGLRRAATSAVLRACRPECRRGRSAGAR
jgi:hypothetical protein